MQSFAIFHVVRITVRKKVFNAYTGRARQARQCVAAKIINIGFMSVGLQLIKVEAQPECCLPVSVLKKRETCDVLLNPSAYDDSENE